MLQRIDHIVIVVRNLAEASADFAAAGFTVTPGGEHLGGATHNALVSFADGTYFELIAFAEPDRPQDHKWWPRLALGEGLTDYALGSDSLADDAERIRQRGLPFEGPVDGGRLRPDGERLAWRTILLGRGASAGAAPSALPFVIEDVTPRPLRVPDGSTTRHRLGVGRAAGLTVVVKDLPRASGRLESLLGAPDAKLAASADPTCPAIRFSIGKQWLELIQPGDAASPAGQYLTRFGDGPYEVTLGRAEESVPGSGELLAGALHGARIRVSR